jgi:hypothetical protein
MILALRLIWSFVLGFRLVAGGKPVSCQRIQGAARIARARLGLAGDVGVCSSERVRCPVIWCWGRNPVLLVPSSSQQADKDIDWVSVVCHELAHWKRLDHIAGLLTELIVCVFAWNPLAWWARRRLLRLSEQACDDWVLASGRPSTDYAESLLELIPQGRMAIAPALVSSKSGLASRVGRILQDKCGNPRTGILWALAVTLVATTLTVGVAFAQTRPAKAAPGQEDPAGGAKQEPAPAHAATVEVRVKYQKDSTPIEGARVSFTAKKTGEAFVVVTNEQGIARTNVAPGDYAMTNVSKEGYRSHKRDVQMKAGIGEVEQIDIELGDAPKVSGYVRDENGNAVAGAVVNMVPYGPRDIMTGPDGKFEFQWDPRPIQLFIVAQHLERNLAGSVEFHSDIGSPLYEEGEAVDIVVRPALTLTGRIVEPSGRGISKAKVAVDIPTGLSGPAPVVEVTTDEHGRYRARVLPMHHRYLVKASAEGYGTGTSKVPASQSVAGSVEASSIILRPAKLSVSGVVVDANDAVVEGAKVKCTGPGQPERQDVTDAAGKFTIENVCEGLLHISATKGPLSGSIRTRARAKQARIVLAQTPVLTGRPPRPTVVDANEPAEKKGGARIAFERKTHDFGQIGPRSKNSCEFKFTNTGDALLKITKVKTSCGCTTTALKKKNYAPGESGAIPVTYTAGNHPSQTTKRITVSSNDKHQSNVTLTIKGTIVLKVDHEPKKLQLVLNAENAGCSDVTLTSLDGQPFAIKSISSPENCIIFGFDSAEQATEFVLKPKVDMEKVKKRSAGQIKISLTHPECKMLTIGYRVLSRFTVTPRSIILRNVEPQKPIKRKVTIVNNYKDDFEIESTSSRNNTVEVLSQEKGENRYTLELQITGPARVKQRSFTDVFRILLKDGEKLTVHCRGLYGYKRKQHRSR